MNKAREPRKQQPPLGSRLTWLTCASQWACRLGCAAPRLVSGRSDPTRCCASQSGAPRSTRSGRPVGCEPSGGGGRGRAADTLAARSSQLGGAVSGVCRGRGGRLESICIALLGCYGSRQTVRARRAVSMNCGAVCLCAARRRCRRRHSRARSTDVIRRCWQAHAELAVRRRRWPTDGQTHERRRQAKLRGHGRSCGCESPRPELAAAPHSVCWCPLQCAAPICEPRANR